MRLNDLDTLPLLTPADMRRTEERAFALGVPAAVLMEHAAMAVVDVLQRLLAGECRGKRVLFLCGTGNNGGDGVAAARLFCQRGGEAEIWLSGEPQTALALAQLHWAQAAGICVRNIRALPEQERPVTPGGRAKTRFDAYVDALLGTGLRGEPDALTTRLINVPQHDFSSVRRPVIAVDIPSGIDGRTGACTPGASMRADVTVTFHAPKPGLYLTRDREAVGEIVLADIGLWDIGGDELRLDAPELPCHVLLPGVVRRAGRRALSAHKGDCGRVLIYAGSMGMAGAAAMCARAAIAAGAGLTTVACPKELIPILQSLVPAAMCMDIADAARSRPAYDVLALGPGLGQEAAAWENILALYDADKPSVWDADALNLLAQRPFRLGERAVMTPHPGEAARLLGIPAAQIAQDRFAAAQALRERFGCAALLKGDVSVLAAAGEPMFSLSANGTPALAKGGSGDVLCGMLAALCARMDVRDAAETACVWHGLAAQAGEARFGRIELTAGQLIDSLYAAREAAEKAS